MVYSATDVSNISDEVVAMAEAYMPSLILIFALLFTIRYFRHLIKMWWNF